MLLIVVTRSNVLFTKESYFVLHRKLVSEQAATETATAAAKVHTTEMPVYIMILACTL